MLELVLGVAGTGKTGQMMGRLKARAEAGERGVLLVPEQFSSTAELMVYRLLGDGHSALVDVLSFRTLAERVLKTSGGAALRLVSDQARVMFVRRALDRLSGRLGFFARHRKDAAFCDLCAKTINELKTAGVKPALLAEIAAEEDDAKFRELAAIFAEYQAVIETRAMDAQDALGLAAERCTPEFFAGTAFYIDNFDGFTAPEYRLLEQVLRHADGVTASLCCDRMYRPGADDEAFDVFAPVRRCAGRLTQMAENAGTGCKAPLLCTAQEQELSGGIFLTPLRDEWEEVRLAAAEMRRLALAGVPYSKMALICRDVKKYESPVRRFFAQYDIPWFADSADTVEYTAPVAFLRAALAVLRQGVASEPMLALLKTGLCGYTESDIIAVENYVYIWRPRAEEWREGFTKNPKGLLQEMDEAAAAALDTANHVRGGLVPLVESFVREARKAEASRLSRALYLLLDRVGAPAAVEAAAVRLEERGEVFYAGRARRGYDICMDLLEQMAALCGGEVLSAQEYDDIFLLLVRATEFGSVPQSLECASFSQADRMRLAAPDYCFVLGLCEGEFPMDVGASGLLTLADRDRLVARGIEMPGGFETRVMLEEMVFYRARTSAKQGLYLSWPERLCGAPMQMCAALMDTVEELRPPPLVLGEAELAATPAAAYGLLGEAYRDDTVRTASLLEAVRESGALPSGSIPLLTDVDNAGAFRVSARDALKTLAGEPLTVSPTRVESFFKCRFAYFVDSFLKVRPLRRAEVSPLESGLFVHHVLERVLAGAGRDFAAWDDSRLQDAVAETAGAFIAEHFAGGALRTQRQLDRVKNSVGTLVMHMRDYARESGFTADAVELDIGRGEGAVPPLALQTPAGETVRVAGQIDRVDVLERDGKTYLCVVDYKTGSRTFDLRDVFCGLNMQMLIYMKTLCENAGGRYPNPVPAGVLYLAADPPPVSGARGDEDANVYKFDGLVLEDPDIVGEMARGAAGIAIPVRLKKDGGLKAVQALCDLEKFGRISAHVEEKIREMATGVYGGEFPAQPLVKGNESPCTVCAYRAVCRHEDGVFEAEAPPKAGLFEPQQGEGPVECGAAEDA